MTDVAGRLSKLAKILKAVALSAIFGVIIVYCALFAVKALLWALPDAPWTHHDKTHVESTGPSTSLASANTSAPSEPEALEPPQVAAASKAAIPNPQSALPASVTTAAPDPASRVGMGDLWINVCGNSRTGYRMCRGSTPTDAQRAADFPPGAKDL